MSPDPCRACQDCPLRAECVSGAARFRTAGHDRYEPLRVAMDERLDTAEGRRAYRRRSWIAETPFAVMKTAMNFRQFLWRGLEKAKTEWPWACTAFNLRKIVQAMANSTLLGPTTG